MAMTCATTTWAEQKRAFRRGREERGARGGAGPRRGSRGARAYLADDLRDVVVAEGLGGELVRLEPAHGGARLIIRLMAVGFSILSYTRNS